MSRLVSGRGVIAANRSRNSSGSKTNSLVVPRPLEPQRDAAVAPQLQATLHPRPIGAPAVALFAGKWLRARATTEITRSLGIHKWRA